MKNTTRISICLALGILLGACGQFTIRPTTALPQPTATFSTEVAAIHTVAAATAFVQLTEIAGSWTATPKPSVTPTATATLKPTAMLPTFLPPNKMPTLEPTKIPGLLKSALSVETLDALNGHNLRRVTGWSYGFDGFEWMDTNHLLLYPIAGWTETQNFGTFAETYPAVINLGSKKTWIPELNKVKRRNGFSNYLPRWSVQLGVLITSSQNIESQNSVFIYSPDGDLMKVYSGDLLGISPSTTKILIADDTWIDLTTGKIVDFAWYQNVGGMDSFSFRPIWSPDETRVYACCYLYGDAKTGKSFGIPYDNITIDGKEVDKKSMDRPLYNSYGTWVLNDTYLLSQWDAFYDSTPSFIPLFDPAAKTYRNLNKLAGLPFDFKGGPNCQRTYAPPGGRYVWVACYSGSYLVDLGTFKSQAYPHLLISSIEWSTDGKFAWVDGVDDLNIQILSTSSKELKPLPANSQSLNWHPTDNILAYLSNKGQTLSLLDARTMVVQKEAALPVEIQQIVWSPDGKQIALLARDSSLWKIDYPKLDNLEQLTPATPNLTGPVYGIKGDMSLIVFTHAPKGSAGVPNNF
jgi:hypothetical protein